MSFRNWINWFSSTPWTLKWFLLFMMARPILASFWQVKRTSVLLSPLNIMGVLLPMLIVASLLSSQKPRSRMSLLDYPFALWAAIVALNSIAILTVELSPLSLEAFFKLMTPVLIYLYLRHFPPDEARLDRRPEYLLVRQRVSISS